ncbi:MAG: isoprenylcysteine carboxylmethyltransferase family protein [Chloroflexota bacterium]
MILTILTLSLFFAGYAVVHSWLASAVVKQWVRDRFGPTSDRWYRLFYNNFAVVSLLPLIVLMALLPNQTLYRAPSPWRWVMVFGQLVALIGLGISLLQTGAFHFLGIQQLFAPSADSPSSLKITGVYRWVRHPLYFFGTLFMWLTPSLSVVTATVFVAFTLYFYVGSIYEERRLIAEFGQAYEQYQQQVPRLIPGLKVKR